MYQMKRVLFVTHHYLNGNGGGIFASRAYINAFCELSGCLTLLYPIKNGKEAEGLNRKVEKIPVPYNKSKVLKFVDLMLGRMHRYFGVFEKYLASGNYDTVVFDTSLVTWKNIGIAHRYGAKVITIHHNYQYEYCRDNSRGPIKFFTLFWIKRYEKVAVRKSDLNITLTGEDRILLKKNYDPAGSSKMEVLGVFESERRPMPESISHIGGRRYVITGSLSDMQTYESLKFWIMAYFPILKTSRNFESLTVAGRNPSKSLLGLCERNGIAVVPNPFSMDDVLLNADIYICPVSLGGGLKLRIMDGLRFGLPVISHEVSTRGYDSVLDKCLFSYSDGKSFADCVARVSDFNYCPDDIQQLYSKQFSYESGLERLKSILNGNQLIS